MSIKAISPIDGRYSRYTSKLRDIASEYGLIGSRVEIMIRYLLALSKEAGIPMRALTKNERARLSRTIRNFGEDDATAIKAIETKGWEGISATNHDVKACELWIRHMLLKTSMADIVEWIHFGSTSEDVNNMAYGLMLRDMQLLVVEPLLTNVVGRIRSFAHSHAALPMLARTHGQPATPTTLGKEFAVYFDRLRKQIKPLDAYRVSLKLNSASGNYNAMYAAVPDFDWMQFSNRFIDSLSRDFGRETGAVYRFAYSAISTQIEAHDTYAELFGMLMRINVILTDFCQDMWRYISDDWIVQKPVAGETGSSIMPHKVNPIQFENAEGNLGIANALMEFCCRKLPISRLQRDLSDSTVERSFGTIIGHMAVAYENIAGGMQKISANEEKIRRTLAEHPEVLAEAYQTILRSVGFPAAYDALKSLSRGKVLTLEDMHAFVDGLDPAFVGLETKELMRRLTPLSYIGKAPEISISALAGGH